MTSDLSKVIEVLEAGVEKHGERPLTNLWLLNMLKAAYEASTIEAEVTVEI